MPALINGLLEKTTNNTIYFPFAAPAYVKSAKAVTKCSTFDLKVVSFVHLEQEKTYSVKALSDCATLCHRHYNCQGFILRNAETMENCVVFLDPVMHVIEP